MKIVPKDKFEDDIRDVIYLKNKKGNEGRGCMCNCKFIILSKDKFLFKSYDKRNLLHEIGHNLGLQHEYNLNKNLMNEGPIKVFHNPTCINSSQIQTMRNNLANIEIRKLSV